MNPIAYARFDLNGLSLRRTPAAGHKPLVFADAKARPAEPTPEEIAKLAARLGWRPPLDRQQAVRDFLADKPLGVPKADLQAATGVKQVLRVLNPMRAAGEVACLPVKGDGARWYLAKHAETVRAARQAVLDAQAQREREQALDRYYRTRAPNSVWQLGAMG